MNFKCINYLSWSRALSNNFMLMLRYSVSEKICEFKVSECPVRDGPNTVECPINELLKTYKYAVIKCGKTCQKLYAQANENTISFN